MIDLFSSMFVYIFPFLAPENAGTRGCIHLSVLHDMTLNSRAATFNAITARNNPIPPESYILCFVKAKPPAFPPDLRMRALADTSSVPFPHLRRAFGLVQVTGVIAFSLEAQTSTPSGLLVHHSLLSKFKSVERVRMILR